jgi:hypothetical protein
MTRIPYFPPEAEAIEVHQEKGFLIDSPTGRADNGYDDNEMEGL